MDDKPPFACGRDAFRAGEPLEANPHPPGLVSGPDYPGAHHNWLAGWKMAQWQREWDRRGDE